MTSFIKSIDLEKSLGLQGESLITFVTEWERTFVTEWERLHRENGKE